jgi:hypothetical protein
MKAGLEGASSAFEEGEGEERGHEAEVGRRLMILGNTTYFRDKYGVPEIKLI